jgi:hypothetical protein
VLKKVAWFIFGPSSFRIADKRLPASGRLRVECWKQVKKPWGSVLIPVKESRWSAFRAVDNRNALFGGIATRALLPAAAQDLRAPYKGCPRKRGKLSAGLSAKIIHVRPQCQKRPLAHVFSFSATFLPPCARQCFQTNRDSKGNDVDDLH